MDPEDLSARSRRRELDERGRRELRRALEGSLEARLLHRAGADFDAEDTVRLGDDELAGRIVARVVATRNRAPRRKRLRGAAITALALCAGTAAAAVAAGPWMTRMGAADATDTALASPAKPPPSPAAKVIARASAAPVPSTAPLVTPEPHAVAGSERPRTTPRAVTPVPPRGVAVPPPQTAANLFASANLARRQGDRARAAALYETLQRLAPGTPEAHAADISLGMLRLEAGSPGSALRHFDRYLRAPIAELAPEALWGKSQALARLGRLEEARYVWQVIASQHPDSAYAKAASAKLSAR